MISWGVDMFFSVDFLLTSEKLCWARDLKAKPELVWRGTKDLDVVMSWLITTERRKKKKKTISPRMYFETKGSKVSIVNALGCLASLSELSAQPHDELKAELRDREDKALLGSSYKEGACVLIK